jgi:hypothetical protein
MSFGESRLKQKGASHHEEHSHPQDRHLPHLGTNWVVLTGWQPLCLEPRTGWHIWVARLLKGFEQGHGCLSAVFLSGTDLEYGAVALAT